MTGAASTAYASTINGGFASSGHPTAPATSRSWTTTDTTAAKETDSCAPLGLTKYRLAKDIGVPPQRIGDIVAGKRGITADTDLRLCRYFGLSDGWWLRGQAAYDIALARESLREELSRIPRCSLLAA